MYILKKIALTVGSLGVGSVIGRAAVSILSRYGPRALEALARLGNGAYEGAERTLLGGINVVWIGGQWVIKKVIQKATDINVVEPGIGLFIEGLVPGMPDSAPNDAGSPRFQRAREAGKIIGTCVGELITDRRLNNEDYIEYHLHRVTTGESAFVAA